MTKRLALPILCVLAITGVESKIPDRSRVVAARQKSGHYSGYHENGIPIEGPGYRARKRDLGEDAEERVERDKAKNKKKIVKPQPWKMEEHLQQQEKQKRMELQLQLQQKQQQLRENGEITGDMTMESGIESTEEFERKLSSQLSGCCYTYQGYKATDLCYMYGQDCESGETPSHDSGDEDCSQDGLSFVGVSFSVNTANGNPYSYQLCDQFPMENIIDRDYEYIMSMDEDGWLVGGGYKTFDYSGKMPYIDSSHTELLRVGNMDVETGGTSIDQVYSAMSSVEFAPFSIYPEYLKGGGGGHSGDDDGEESVPSGDITLIVSVVETYDDDSSYSSYELFLEDLFNAMDAVGGGPCMDDHDTDPHVSMSRGVKFWSAYHQQQYMYEANLEVAVWQSMYPNGVPIGSKGDASFPPGRSGTRQYVGYGNLYFFFDRANITKAFRPYRELTDNENYYSTMYMSSDVSYYYSKTTSIDFDYSGSRDNDGSDYEHNAYGWDSKEAMHDMTDGWDLPPNCLQEGETFLGIPLSRTSDSKLQSSSSFQEQFDFEFIVDRNGTYVTSFGTNHGWLVGEELGNAVGSIVDKDTSHIPVFTIGTTNKNLGGMSLGDMIKIAKNIDFGTLYIKPAFVYVDADGHLKLQFEADSTSALGYLYDNLCKELGISWNYHSPSNKYDTYTNCAMHAAGDRASYGCGPDSAGNGGFCPSMTLAYGPRFASEDHAAAYLYKCNNYVDYWRSLYPSGVAVGTTNFCPSGGCLALFLNRLDVYEVFKPDLGGSWVEYNGASMPPTYSPAPTWKGGCDEPHNVFLDKCVRKKFKPKPSAVAWDALGSVGQISVLLVVFMAVTLSVSIFLARARKKRRRGESYLGFFFRDLTRKKRRKRRKRVADLEESMLPDNQSRRSKSSGRRSSRSRASSRSKRRSRSTGASKSGRDRSRSRSLRPVPVQPAGRARSRDTRGGGGDGGEGTVVTNDGMSVASASSRRSGVFDLAVTSPQPGDNDGTNKRQQLV